MNLLLCVLVSLMMGCITSVVWQLYYMITTGSEMDQENSICTTVVSILFWPVILPFIGCLFIVKTVLPVVLDKLVSRFGQQGD